MSARAAVLAIGAVAAAALPGCGAPEKADPDTITQAARVTDDRGGVHLAFEAKLDIEGAPKVVTMRAEGDEDRRARTATYEVDMSEFTELDPEAAGSPDLWRGSMIRRGPVAWIRLGLLENVFDQVGFERARWLETDLGQPVDKSSELGRSLAELNEQDPGQILDYVHAAEATERLGEETVAGVRAVRYRGRVVLDEVAARLPPGERAAVQANSDRVKRATGEDEVPVDVWIGADGLIRQVRLNYDFDRNPETNQKLDAELTATVHLSGFGRRVRARVPPRESVVTVPELVQASE